MRAAEFQARLDAIVQAKLERDPAWIAARAGAAVVAHYRAERLERWFAELKADLEGEDPRAELVQAGAGVAT